MQDLVLQHTMSPSGAGAARENVYFSAVSGLFAKAVLSFGSQSCFASMFAGPVPTLLKETGARELGKDTGTCCECACFSWNRAAPCTAPGVAGPAPGRYCKWTAQVWHCLRNCDCSLPEHYAGELGR